MAVAAIAALRDKQRVKIEIEDQAKINWTPDLPSESDRLADFRAAKFSGGGSDGANGEWQPRRVVYSRQSMYFTRENDEAVVDIIPLHQITAIEVVGPERNQKSVRGSLRGPFSGEGVLDAQKADEANNDDDKTADYDNPNSAEVEEGTVMKNLGAQTTILSNTVHPHAFNLYTLPGGHNSGRIYRLKVGSDAERNELVDALRGHVKTAIRIEEDLSMFQRSQEKTRKVFTSLPFQSTVAFLIFANFITQAIENQIWPEEGSSTHRAFQSMDIIFTVLFTLELCINMYAHWCKPFFSDGWSIFDLIVVSFSLISLFMDAIPGVSVLRVMRAFRVLRLFGRLKALRKIINALTASIVPVMNAFVILALVLMIYALVGIGFFADRSEEFSTFGHAVITMFLLVAGETWLPDMPPFQDNGHMDVGVVVFCVSFIVIVNWTLLQVSVTVLLDSFVTATAEEERVEEIQEIQTHKTRTEINTLDPLLSFFVDHFDTNEDLSLRIQNLFRVLDVDGSGRLDHEELIVGLRKIDCEPRINVSLDDIESFMYSAGLDPKHSSSLDLAAFDAMLRGQIKEFTQRGVTDAILATGHVGDNKVGATLTSLKMLLVLTETGQHTNKVALHETRGELLECMAAVEESIHNKIDIYLSALHAQAGMPAPAPAGLEQRSQGLGATPVLRAKIRQEIEANSARAAAAEAAKSQFYSNKLAGNPGKDACGEFVMTSAIEFDFSGDAGRTGPAGPGPLPVLAASPGNPQRGDMGQQPFSLMRGASQLSSTGARSRVSPLESVPTEPSCVECLHAGKGARVLPCAVLSSAMLPSCCAVLLRHALGAMVMVMSQNSEEVSSR